MNISYNWLREYLKVYTTPQEVIDALTSIGLEVEGAERIEAIRGGLEGVVIGEVMTCTAHPDSDHLHVTSINIGMGDELGIVCGAPNVAKGQKVAVATIGTTLYPIGAVEGFKIKRSKIRGVESLGMICAEDELGLGSDHDGIMVLAADALVGTPLKDYLEQTGKYKVSDDWRIAIGLTPNRIDAASHYGTARDLAAYFKARSRKAETTLPLINENKLAIKGKSNIKVRVEDSEGAPRYAGIVIEGIQVAPSPEWLQERLRSIGLNPHNNVVDVTNFVLHELCQPLHSFDADKITGNEVVVRTCATGTKFVTLDGIERTLSGDEVMICNASEAMCIAGVMGGQDSGVSETTTRIFLESAYFNPVRIRKAARRHGLNTDASFRFERGIDPNITIFALKRAAELICEISGGYVASDIIDIYPQKIENFKFDISLNRINSLIGKQLELQTIKIILAALEIDIETEQGDTLSISVPPYRVDVQREADVVEEILRIYGYNNVEFPSSVRSSLAYGERIDKERLTNKIGDMLASVGFTEIMGNSLTKGSYYDDLTYYPQTSCVKLLNPLSADLNVMRQTLLFNALEAVSLNINHRRSDLKLFEIGNTYHYAEDLSNDNPLSKYTEKNRLGITIAGNWVAQSWNEAEIRSNFFHLKAITERIFRLLGIDFYSLKCEVAQNDLFSEAIVLKSGEKVIATLGIVSQKARAMTDIKTDVYFAEIEVEELLKLARKIKVQAHDLPRFPKVVRDLALLVDVGTNFATLRDIAFATERKLLKNVSLFDVYEGDKLPAGKKSYALSFSLQDMTQTLTEQQIERTMANLIKQYKEKVGAQIRQ